MCPACAILATRSYLASCPHVPRRFQRVATKDRLKLQGSNGKQVLEPSPSTERARRHRASAVSWGEGLNVHNDKQIPNFELQSRRNRAVCRHVVFRG